MGHSAGGHVAVEYLKVSTHDILDYDSLFNMGHSAGGHVAVEYLKVSEQDILDHDSLSLWDTQPGDMLL